MKSTIITAVLGLALGASASVTTVYGANGAFSVISTPDSPTPTPARARLARSADAGCSNCRDRCLRSVISASLANKDFCTSFLATTYTAATDFAPVLTPCVSADRVSSACSCFVQPTKSSSTTSSTPSATPTTPSCNPAGGHCSISNFIQVCCHGPDGGVGCSFLNGDPNDGQCFTAGL